MYARMNQTKRFKRFTSGRGFTLLEVMLVLTLIVILSSIAMPSLRGFSASARLNSSAASIRDMLNFARDMAITERTAYLVVFDLSQNRYWLASSETFSVSDINASLGRNASNTVNQTEIQSSESSQPSISRTSTILGIPQELNHNISLAQMVTNHDSQTRQINSGVDYIYFSSTSSSEDTNLYLQDHEGKTVSITVEAASARVRIQDVGAEESRELGLSGRRSNDLN